MQIENIIDYPDGISSRHKPRKNSGRLPLILLYERQLSGDHFLAAGADTFIRTSMLCRDDDINGMAAGANLGNRPSEKTLQSE